MNSSDYEYKVTAIVLVYNGQPYLNACLESLVEQTLEGLEILLINDASTDDSLSICKEFERDYDNVKVINKEMNEGLASSANMGIKLAKGEYIILVDNDDIIPCDAYEKLYTKAKQTDSDICIGKANFLRRASQDEMDFHENYVWAEERTIDDVSEFPEVFHDAFYWNKIIRRDLLIEKDIKLPFGMIYADRSFSHKAYIHANRISIIPDCVYMWRVRLNSLSMKRKELENYINRIDSYKLELDELVSHYSDYFKFLIRRIIIPIGGMLEDKEFEEYFFSDVYDFMNRQIKSIEDIYDNDLTNEYNIILYMILNNQKEKLKEFLNLNLEANKDILDENGKSYWNLPQFRNPEFNIPDEFFEIKFLERQFVNMDISLNRDSIIFNNITIPENFEMETGYVVFKGLTTKSEAYANNCLYYEVEKMDGANNSYCVEVPLDNLNIFEIYDIYFKSINKNQIPNEFRISKSNIDNLIRDNEDVLITFSISDHLEIITQMFDDAFEFECSDECLKLKAENSLKIKKNVKIYLEKEGTSERFLLMGNDEKTAFGMAWKFFLDKNAVYDINMVIFNDYIKLEKRIKLNKKHMKNFKEISHKYKDINVKIYEKSTNIALKTN